MESALHLIILSVSLSIFSVSAYIPTTAYFLNCGSSTNITFSDNPPRTFTTDSPFLSSSTSNSVSVTDPINQSNSLYNTSWLFTQTSSYNFPIKTTGTHVLRLHFFAFTTKSYNLINSSNFNVSSPQTFFLGSFSPPNTSTIKEYYLWLDTDGLTLTFTPNSPSLAFISAIELFTAPPYLIDDTEPTTVTTTGKGLNIGDLSRQSLETLYRVNVGGPLITPTNDTLWRTWVPDDPFLFPISSSKEENISPDRIKYGPNPRSTAEVAPQFVYSTVREMNIPNTTRDPNFNFNLTWTFKVPAGYKEKNRVQGVVENSGLLNVSVGRSSKSTPTTVNAIMNGLEIMKINNSVGSLNGSYNPFASNSRKRSTHVGITVIIVSAVAAALVVIIIAIIVIILTRKKSKPAPAPSPLTAKANTTAPVSWSPYRNDGIDKSSSGATPRMKMGLELYIPLSDIKLATNDFDEALVIGHGGFGKVYKGVLSNGMMVAVKRAMGRSRQGYPEFVNEINLLSKIRHRHLVSIIGYCDEMGEMILVYEFMENGTLKNYLYGSPDLPCLSWKQRLQVCIGAARGLDYLHTAHSPVIIHRDVKSTNILLGQDFLAKISDFGISKLGPLLGEDTYVSTGVKGSFGYFDPEYFTMLKLTTKSDVYSFGVVLFEVLCARPVIDPRFKDEAVNLADWALHYLKKGKLEKIIDVRLAGKINPKSLEKFGKIAERCLAKHGDDRPTIGDVLWDLEYALQLQETELMREPHEDSGTVDSQIQYLSLMRRVSFACTDIDEDNNVIEMSSEQLDVNP
ncbi:Non-specific serine/threonine protein kinase protein [Dioscorea alata]|uniref:Non-specific serine/threonine protein kinase protein n=1 Tax=Dioscorea alata TaxID=55571 RepID=A0ACB7TZE8_DIOAL|nr:Non-specific serine/threonine protein kinase protein [Dioscorea alata]